MMVKLKRLPQDDLVALIRQFPIYSIHIVILSGGNEVFFLQFSTHDVVVLKLNKADLGSPALGQGVVYRLKVTLSL